MEKIILKEHIITDLHSNMVRFIIQTQLIKNQSDTEFTFQYG